MAHRIAESDLLIRRVNSREVETPLLSSSPILHGPRSLLKYLSYLPCNICVNSKPALLILVWSVVMGAVYLCLLSSFGVLGYILRNTNRHSPLETVIPTYTLVAAYAFLAIVLLLYPLSGYLADVHCGRYKTVTKSLLLFWVAMIFLSAAAILALVRNFENFKSLKYIIPLGLCVLFFILLIIVSLAGYQANIVQLGLDQLLEAPSEKLGLFVHWLMWAYSLGAYIILLPIILLPCYIEVESTKQKFTHFFTGIPFASLFFLTLLLTFTFYNRSWFYSEPGQNNPYKTVFQVLNFARKNKYPLRRSAFTFCDDFRPSRIDFAKERFGGPFTSPQVEDVKTFLRIVLVLFALGPVFVLEVPGSYYLFPLFALHVAQEVQFIKHKLCHSVSKWVLLQSRSLGYISSIVFLPVYIWIVFSFLHKKIPKILCRLWSAVLISLSGVLSLLIVDLAGHIRYHYKHPAALENATEGVCLFTSHVLYPKLDTAPIVLKLHWGVTIVPSILLSFGQLLVHATSFEFISAQSPHSMKGLLVGVFFAIKGLFQFISAAAVVPFAIPNIWNHIYSVTNCGFGYYLFTIVVASIGLVVFSVVVRSYKYRQRDEKPYDQRFAEAYYERYIGSTNSSAAAALHSPNDDLTYHDQYGITVSINEDTTASDSEDYSATEDSKLLHKLPDNISSRYS